MIKRFRDTEYFVHGTGVIVGPRGILKPYWGNTGYLRVMVTIGGKRRNFSVHRLVAEVFLGRCPPGMQCNHKNGKKWDNDVKNLEWVSQSDNMRHAVDTGLQKILYGEDRWNSKMSREGVLAARRAYAMGASRASLAACYGVTRSTMNRLLAGETWQRV